MFSLSRINRLVFWVLGIVLCVGMLLTTAFLFAEHFLSSSILKEKIQQILDAQSGIAIDYEKLGIQYFPTPALELHQLSFSAADTLKGKADLLKITPKMVALLKGELELSKVELVRPDCALELARPHPAGHSQNTAFSSGSKDNQGLTIASLLALVPVRHLNIIDGRLSVVSNSSHWVGDHLDLIVDSTVANTQSRSAILTMQLADLSIHVGSREEILQGVQLKGTFSTVNGQITCQFDQLTVANPALALAGTLTLLQEVPGVNLSLTGTNIDVDATRKTALALAGDVSPVNAIFSYLGGGTIPQITISSQGKDLSELADLRNIQIKGHLQDGAISIHKIDLNLTKVNGEVMIVDGVLTATGLQARLAGSTGHSGMLKIGLTQEKPLFQMEMMLTADLGQAQRIVQRIVHDPRIAQELDRITDLKGTGTGKLILGDSLTHVQVRLENADMNLSFNYQGVPYPIKMSKGNVNVMNDQIALRGASATLGKSEVTGFDATVTWAKKVHLDVSAEHSGLVLDELYPWLNSMKGVKLFPKDCQGITGRLDVSSARFTGSIDAPPQQWRSTAAVAISGIELKINDFPGSIKLAKGKFKLDSGQLTVQNVLAAGLDANLSLNGRITNTFSSSGQHLDLTVDGTMGKESVVWLQDRLKIPKAYALRPPLMLSSLRVVGLPARTLLISGGITVKDGPQLTLALEHQPEGLKVEKLTVKDQHSEAAVTLLTGQKGLEFSFVGFLSSETLGGLFADSQWGKGRVEGDFSVQWPEATKTGGAAKGFLQGNNIQIPLPSGHGVLIPQILLKADGSKIQAQASSLSWRDITWSPVAATLSFDQDMLVIKIDQAALCGIDSPGVVMITGKYFDIDLSLQGKNVDVSTSYSCLTRENVKMTGTLEFSSQIKAKGQMGELINKLEGPLQMTFRKGVIEQGRVLSILLKILNVTEIVKGRLPHVARSGFTYSVITVDGRMSNGKLVVDKLLVDGETANILGSGEIDMAKATVNLELLASPFKTVDSIIKHIPGVNYLMRGSLVMIPVSVKGEWANPKVSLLSPSAVSKNVLQLGARTLKLPYKVLESVLSGGRK